MVDIKVKIKEGDKIKVYLNPPQGVKIDLSNKYLWDPNVAQGFIDLTESYKNQAKDSADSAEEYKNQAMNYADDAMDYASQSESSANASEEAKDISVSAKNEATAQAVIATNASNNAVTQANIATTKAGESQTYANNAHDSELNAKTSEDNAKASELESQRIETSVQGYTTQAMNYADDAMDYASQAESSAQASEEAKDLSISAKNEATSQATIATNASNNAVSQANIATSKAGEAETYSNNARQSELNAKSSEQNASTYADNALVSANNAHTSELNAQAVLERLGTVIKIKGRVNRIEDLPTTGNLDGDTYLVGVDGLDSYPEYYWYSNHWEFLGTSAVSLQWGAITGTLSNQTDLQTALDNIQGKLTNVTYAELVSLKNNAQLKEGAFYRITDYVTTTNGKSSDSTEPSRSAGHQFDIIIQALGKSNLSDIGTCALHEGDTYFAKQNLGAWQIWYDINNDTNKYHWAVTDGTGKGVIYRMIDENQNDLPYDFKNIQFYRDKTLSKYSHMTTILKSPDNYYYTFHSISKNSDMTISSIPWFDNIISTSKAQISSGKIVSYGYSFLNNLIMISDSTCHDNSFGANCFNSTFYTLQNNKFGFNNHSNIVASVFALNEVTNYFENNKFLDTSKQVSGNRIQDSFYNNTVNGLMQACYIGNNFHDNVIGNNFQGNKIGIQFQFHTLGINFIQNNVGNNCKYNNFGDHFWQNNVGNAVQYISTPTSTNTKRFRYFNIQNGVAGSSATNKLSLDGLTQQATYNTTVGLDSSNKITATWEDNGITVGKVKSSVTATTWTDIVPTLTIDNWEE